MHAQDKAETAILAWSLVVCGYVFFLPVSHNIILLPLVASLGAIAAYWFFRRRAAVHFGLLIPAGIWLVFVLYGSITAGLFGAESWLRVMTFMFAIPLFYFLLTVVFRRSFIRPLLNLGAGVSILVAVILISQAIVAMGALTFMRLPGPFYEFINLRYAVDPSGPLRFTSNVLPPLLWWGAMWMASIFVSSRDAYLPPMAIRVIATVLCLTASIFSLRRAIIVALVATPVTIAIIALVLFAKNSAERTVRFKPTNVFLLVGAFAAAAAIVLTVQPKSYEIVAAVVKSIVAVTTDDDVVLGELSPRASPIETEVPIRSDGSNLGIKGTTDIIRQYETRILLTPANAREAVFGRGFGATINRGSYFREALEDRPWQSELSYHMVFYWSGYIGVALVGLVAIAGAFTLRFAMRRAADLNGVLFIAAVGAVALLIANVSNPYMQALGHLWPLFFPFMIANVILNAMGNAGSSDLAVPESRHPEPSRV